MNTKYEGEARDARLWSLTDEQWSLIEPLFPHADGRKGFEQKIPSRTVMEAVLYRDRIGCPWRDLPGEYGLWHTIYVRWQRWVEGGVIGRVLAVLQEAIQAGGETACIDSTVVRAHQHAAGARKRRGPQALGRSKGGFSTKTYMASLDETHAAAVILTPGEAGDAPVGEALVKLLETLGKGDSCIADKAYDSDAIRERLRESGREAVIPPKSNRKEPISFDEETYKERNKIERLFNRAKQFRAVATRYDKLACMFMGMITAAFLFICLHQL